MKKLLLIAALAIGAQAGGIWDMVKNTAADGKLTSKMYVIDTAGVDNRLYVVNVPDMKSICAITYGERGNLALHCKTYKEMDIQR